MPFYSKAFVSEMRQVAIDHHTCPQCLAPARVACLRKRPGRDRTSVHGPRFDLALGRAPRDHTIDRRLPQRVYQPLD